jgi:hypothetical protein
MSILSFWSYASCRCSGAAIAHGRERAGLGDFIGAKAAFEDALTDPEHADHARMLLHDLEIERTCREAISLLVQYEA